MRALPAAPRAAPRLVIAAGALLAIATAAPAARAQTSPEPPRVADARAAFDRGVAAIDAGRFDVAAQELEASYRLNPEPAVLVNLAIARRGQGHYRDAIAALERFLGAPGSRPDAALVERAERTLARLRAQLGTLVVRATPAGVAVAVDGQVTPQAASAAGVALDPGVHHVELAADGFQIERRAVDLHSGETARLEVRMVPLGGGARLQVGTPVPQSEVRVDGAYVGRGRVELALAPGRHRVEVRAPGYDPVQREVRLGVTGVVRLDLLLVRAGPPRWLLPAGLAVGGALVVGGIVAGVAYAAWPTAAPTPGTWHTVTEAAAR